MKTTYKDLIINFEREVVPEDNIKWYGSAWVDGCLICRGGQTIEELCEHLHKEVELYLS